MFDTYNQEQQKAYELIAQTHSSFFLTGKAGTGKTTFIHRIQEEIPKTFLVLAPTGIAAIIAGGETIHSFFGFPTEVLVEDKVWRLNPEKVKMIRKVDTIIVDEVSMVRCDVIDAMDRALRAVMSSSQPFGRFSLPFIKSLMIHIILTTNSQSESFCSRVFWSSTGFLSKPSMHFSFAHASAFSYSALS